MKKLTPEEQEQVYKSVLDKYREASSNEDIEEATKNTSRNKTIANIGQAIEGMGRARSVARGAKGVDGSFYESLKADQDKKLADQRALKKDKVENVLTEDSLLWTDKERSQKEKGWKAENDFNNPQSNSSKAIREQYKRMFPDIAKADGFDTLSANDIKNGLSDPIKLRESIDARKEEARQRAADRAAMAQGRKLDKEDERAWKEEQKEKEVTEKKKTLLNEVEDRRTNIHSALDELDKKIEEDGTFEMFGSHNQDMDRLVDQIATDMAKLQDPSSVARPSEVEAVKKNLIESGFKNSNSTARQIIKNFRAEVERRADSAYKIRGVEKPGQKKSFHGSDLP